jgi:hypothetical protein
MPPSGNGIRTTNLTERGSASNHCLHISVDNPIDDVRPTRRVSHCWGKSSQVVSDASDPPWIFFASARRMCGVDPGAAAGYVDVARPRARPSRFSSYLLGSQARLARFIRLNMRADRLAFVIAADKSASLAENRFYRAVAMEASTNMVFIPPGTFRMGSPDDEEGRDPWEGPQTEVTISQGFWIGTQEVTQSGYTIMGGNNQSWFKGVRHEGTPLEIDYGPGWFRPVERVSWHDAVAYSEGALSMRRSFFPRR